MVGMGRRITEVLYFLGYNFIMETKPSLKDRVWAFIKANAPVFFVGAGVGAGTTYLLMKDGNEVVELVMQPGQQEFQPTLH